MKRSPPPKHLTALAAALAALTLALPATAQTPPACTGSTCTFRVAGVPGGKVVQGCGEQATPGRFKAILSSSAPGATPASFPRAMFFQHDERRHAVG